MTDPELVEKSGPATDENDEDASEAQAQVIASLRAQVTDLFSQVAQLNGKLVSSYDRVSDLEDQLHDSSSQLRNASVTISSLELERSHHLAALNTGLLVEKAHVTAELNRLMERATEEAAQRGQAEIARRDIEKDLDDLSASLFDQANNMVAEARFGQAKSERKVQDAEQALKIAEDAVKDMQVQMQSLSAEKEAAERDVQEAKLTMGKGKWVERDDLRVGDVPRIRFMTTHSPYAEFIAFVAHLRGLRTSQPAPPAISTLLSQPFIARLINEDSEPTVRLDLAPSLNWLSRRSVLTAIHTGMLTVEPMPFSSLVHELHQHPQSISSSTLSCALCGTLIARLSPTIPISRTNSSNGSSWFKYPLALSSSQNNNPGTLQSTECEPPGQVYIFRLATPTASTASPTPTPTHTPSLSMSAVGNSSRPPLNVVSSSRVVQAQTQNSPYPLCTSNYCLTRLRSTCSLWAFVRVGVVERVWEEEVFQPSRPLVNGGSQEKIALPNSTSQPASSTSMPLPEKPPVPPRRRRLWEMASALGERAVSWGKESVENAKEKDGAKKLPSPPPSHPSAPHPHTETIAPRVDAQDPPPLPMHNVQNMITTDTPSSTENRNTALENDELAATTVNGHIESDKADSNTSDSPVTPVHDVAATPPSEMSPPLTMSHPDSAESSAQPVHDQQPSPPSTTIPLPVTPTTSSPIARVTSPVSRPRSRLSSPASPPQNSRPASPAVSRSRAGSPAPTRTGSPSHTRAKPSIPSPLVSSTPTSPTGPGAPPLPRRAAARRAVPPLPAPVGPKAAAGGGKEGVVLPEAHGCKASEAEVPAETKSSETGGGRPADVVNEVNVPQSASVSASVTDAASEPTKDVMVGHGGAEGLVNGTSPIFVPDRAPPPASEGDGYVSVDTASTKRSSGTEGEGFASDATWEERTWKELVKLKEDMFLARIGGIRTLHG